MLSAGWSNERTFQYFSKSTSPITSLLSQKLRTWNVKEIYAKLVLPRMWCARVVFMLHWCFYMFFWWLIPFCLIFLLNLGPDLFCLRCDTDRAYMIIFIVNVHCPCHMATRFLSTVFFSFKVSAGLTRGPHTDDWHMAWRRRWENRGTGGPHIS